MDKQLGENLTVSSFYLWFLLHGTQTGIAMLTFPSKIILGAEGEAWVSILITGLSIHLIIWMIFFVLKHSNHGDIISLHQQLFGKWFGNVLTLGFYGYTLMFISTQIRSYVEVLHVWIFQLSPPWEMTLIILLTSIYIVSGGFRVITGICFWCVIIPSLLLVTLYFPLKYAHWNNFLPLLNHNIAEYTESAQRSLPLFLGVEFLLLYYPYIKNNEKSQKWAHIAVAHTTLLYMFFACVIFAYFNVEELKHTIWPTLILSKIIRFPFFERFDYIYVFNWFLIILPTICIGLWGGTRILRKTVGFTARPALWITSIIVFIIIVCLKGSTTIDRLDSLMSMAGLIFLYGYIPLLVLWISIIRFFKRGSLSARIKSE
ncbi:GerAB/ArcD/ProY family transporter [Paenibacillus psychroresistens]|uniref:GerAB/ArcD/ProY family transporter n=1 Tax=Paenibacillus psychroresistens TaxID=1778678 RepID=UPI0013915976|nr:GerAB/ArcD/ProY family transporter [Paenibacillus psychroresistens]